VTTKAISIDSIAAYVPDALKLERNPFAGIKVAGVKPWKASSASYASGEDR
jgi:hypothetical protein